MEFKIEKGVPVAPIHKTSKYPWEQMEAGDSFVVPAKDADEAKLIRTRLSSSGSRYLKTNGITGIKVRTRFEDNGVRVHFDPVEEA